MANIEQGVTAVVGAVVGFFIGGPTGAAYGFQIGLLAGSALFPVQLPTVYGPRLQDSTTTVAQLGGPIGITYGTFAVAGQVMALGCVEEVERSERVGGKGSPPEQTIINFEYFQTIAVGLCEGEICGVQRIWENGELKFDVREQQENETADQYAARLEMSGVYALTFTLYLGTELQEADPDLELIFGEGLVPGFRGVAYVVFPDRRLNETQALRHPQWRFEVVRGTGVRGVTPATLLDGPLDGFQTNQLLPDWAHNRFFAFDFAGSEGSQGVRAFQLRTNTEYLQRTLADIGIGDPIALYHATVGIDGFIYMVVTYHNQGPAVLYRLDPETLDIVQTSTAPLSRNQWINAITIRVEFGVVIDFLITVSALNNAFWVYRADTLINLATFEDGREEGMVCSGPVSGSHSYAYGLSYDEASSGTTDGIDVLKFDCEIDGLFFQPTASVETVGRIAHSTLQSDWIRTVEVAGLVFDTEDSTIIFSVTGAATTGVSPVSKRLVKMNPETLEVIWNVADPGTIQPVDDFNHNLGRIAGGRYAVATAPSSVTLIDTRTGEILTESWAGDLPGQETLTGEEIYDAVTNCLLTYEADTGPVLLCLSSCTSVDVTLGEIVADVCDRSGVPVGGYDVSELTQIVHGYGIGRNMPGRQAIEVLRPVGSFDSCESGTVIRFPVRGSAPIKTYEVDELSAHPAGDECPPTVTTDKMQSVELPRIVRVHYIAPSRDYEPGEKLSPSRFSPEVENELDIDVPVALEDSQAFQIAEIVHSDAWAGRWRHAIANDVSALAIEPTDVVLVPVDGRLYRCRVESIEEAQGGLLRRMALVRDDDGAFVSSAVADPPLVTFPPGPNVISDSQLVLLDLPPLREEDDDPGLYGVVYRSQPGFAWQGAVIARSVDAGATWGQMAAVGTEGTVGALVAPVGVAEPTAWDTRNEVLVDLRSGSVESRAEAAVINGANAIAVGAHGRWEIIQFLDAEAVSSTRFRLTGLLRGRRGTEVHIGTSVAGDTAVLLSDGTLLRLGLQSSDVGQEYLYRATTVGLTGGASVSQNFTGAGQALEAWAPVTILGARDGSDNLTITFSRRSRFGSDLTPAGDNLPLTESPESYEIDVLGLASPDEVLRTISTSVESAAYTAAQQTTDFGSPQAEVTVRIYQLSPVVGRGLAGEATI